MAVTIRNSMQRGYKSKVSFTGEKSRTLKSFAKQCNINNIMAKYKKTGTLPLRSISGVPMFFDDFTNVSDFQSMQNKVIEADRLFSALPAKVRARFENEPAQLMEFIKLEGNKVEAMELGILKIPEGKVLENGKLVDAPPKVVPPTE